MPTRRTLWFLGLLLALSPMPRSVATEAPQSALPTEPSPTPRTVLLRYRFQKGATLAHRLRMEGKGTATMAEGGVSLPLTLVIEMRITQKVVRVHENGEADVETTTTLDQALLNGISLSETARSLPKVQARMSPLGEVLEAKPTNGGPSAGGLPGIDAAALVAITQRLSFPERPVKVGDSWSVPTPPNGEADFRATTTLEAVEEVNGREVARLKQTFAMPVKVKTPGLLGAGEAEATGRQAGDLTMRFDTAAGKILEAAGTVDSVMTLVVAPGMNLDLRLRITVRMEEKPEVL